MDGWMITGICLVVLVGQIDAYWTGYRRGKEESIQNNEEKKV